MSSEQLNRVVVCSVTIRIASGEGDSVYLDVDRADTEDYPDGIAFTLSSMDQQFSGSELAEITRRVSRVIGMKSEIEAFWRRLENAANQGESES